MKLIVKLSLYDDPHNVYATPEVVETLEITAPAPMFMGMVNASADRFPDVVEKMIVEMEAKIQF